MLVQLSISDFAIIKHLEITLKSELNILSGETGAGKSIIINAVNLILGGRASSALIRSGCKEARVEALFSLPENPVLTEMLYDLGIPFDGELLIKRAIPLEGRNRIIVNGSMVTLQMLARLGAMLISISGQHESQFLLKQDNHLYLLDDFGGLSDARLTLGKVFGRFESLKAEVLQLTKEIREAGDRQELNRFQIQEIEGAGLAPGEDERLVEEKRRLQHASELLGIVSEGYQSLYESNDSLLSRISQHVKKMDTAVDIDARLSPIRESLAEIGLRLEDASISLRDFQGTIHIDPSKLEEVEDRLEVLNSLKRKYGPTLEDVLAFRDQCTSMIYELDEKRERLDQLIIEQQEVESELMNRAKDLSKMRKKVAKKLEEAVIEELKQLRMADTRFHVHFEMAHEVKGEKANNISSMRSNGLDMVEFMISPNIGEELKPLSKIASGGELSRIMLALKTILARTGSVETIIFDEVDSGISGAAAAVIGEKLRSLAGYHQILCITHLPQIASQGQTHFLAKKEVINGRTQTDILELDYEARVREVARLLGGRKITPTSLANAEEMLG